MFTVSFSYIISLDRNFKAKLNCNNDNGYFYY